MKGVKLLYIDLFCGAGGTSTGVELCEALVEELNISIKKAV